jgi:8-oxo-dGTP diphosphatase
MPDRPTTGPRAGLLVQPPVAELCLVCCAVVDGGLAVLTAPNVAGGRPVLPAAPLAAGADPDAAAARAARALLGRAPAWIAQGRTRAGAGAPPLTITYVLVVPAGSAPPAGCVWQRVGRGGTVDALGARASQAVAPAVALLRDRMDLEPVAFRMLPPAFTLSELQHLYELLLGRRLHKASFRRVLHAAGLVRATGAWRSEGRGRPAQLFRYAPGRARRGAPRSVRLELLR